VARGSVENMQRLHEMGQSQLFEVKAKSGMPMVPPALLRLSGRKRLLVSYCRVLASNCRVLCPTAGPLGCRGNAAAGPGGRSVSFPVFLPLCSYPSVCPVN